MSIMITAYGQNGFCEFLLPVASHTKTEIELTGETTGFAENLTLQFEAPGENWFIRNTYRYAVGKQRGIADGPLADGDMLILTNVSGGKVSMLVRETAPASYKYQRYELTALQTFSVGSDGSNQITYQYQGLVSAQHAVIQRTPMGFCIRNLGSNGSFVNGRKIVGARELLFGDCVDIFGLKLIYLGDAFIVSAQGNFGLASVETHKVVLTYVMDHSQVYEALFTTKIIVGRNSSSVADLLLPDDFVSERHCEIGVTGGRFYIKDLGSSNGTFVNGNKIDRATEIISGCGIKLGSKVYMVTVE